MILFKYFSFGVAIAFVIIKYTLQDCPAEVSHGGLSVTWPATPSGHETLSIPVCYNTGKLLKRYCNDTQWSPELSALDPCTTVMDYFNLTSCPPGFHKISGESSNYCYSIGDTSMWNYPCLKTGGVSILTNFTNQETDDLLKTLVSKNVSRFYWLPAQRRKSFNPLIWYVPGPNWGREIQDVRNNILTFQTSIVKNCLLLDIEERLLTTENCNNEYPNLCFYPNKLQYPGKCPAGYYAYRFIQDYGTCFGIEVSDTGLSFNDFLATKCKKPMGDNNSNDLTRFIFKNIAEIKNLGPNQWCWFKTVSGGMDNVTNLNESDHMNVSFSEQVINYNGNLRLRNSFFRLHCMACETEMEISNEVTLQLEYDTVSTELHLTIYFPSDLWKYDETDNGIQCFSNARGFVRVIDVNNIPVIEIENAFETQRSNSSNIEKLVYTINLIADTPAQYWCEGHTRNFSLLSTSKVIANPRGSMIHVFALVLNMTVDSNTAIPNFSSITSEATKLFEAETVLLMDILEYPSTYCLFLLHLHIPVTEIYDNEADNLLHMSRTLINIAKSQYTDEIRFVNLTSSLYCMPTTTKDSSGTLLQWDLTLLGHVVAPKQFCLQNNGLPVKRRCEGSYLLGGYWGSVDGHCDQCYQPSQMTAFLYNFLKGEYSENYTTRFLTDGLDFVLGNTSLIIPADIYYLSMSLQHVINVAKENETSVDLGDIDNIAWAMDRVMILDYDYLRLSQTLNSTNVILDSIIDIIEMISKSNSNNNVSDLNDLAYQIAVEPQFIVQISYPLHNNISGIAIIRETNENYLKHFTGVKILPLYSNTTMTEILSYENIEVATWVPEKVIKSLKLCENESFTNEEELHIVISIFYNDAVFQQLDTSRHRVNSRIIGITIPGFVPNLEHSIPIIFKEINYNPFNKYCGYWDFQQFGAGNNSGFWSNNGCFHVKSTANVTICECYHMTHFGQLFDIGSILYPANVTVNIHTQALNIITLVGCFLSLLGVFGIWVTALVFQAWRQKASTKVLLQLSTSVALPLIFIVVFNFEDSLFIIDDNDYTKIVSGMENVCILLGAMLHYSILSSFMWMLITAVLQFIRYVRVLGVGRPSRFLVKFALVGWGVPLVPVIIVLASDMDSYLPDSTGRICYPTGIYFIICVVAPIVIILVINVILFILVITSISRGPDGKIRMTDIDLVGAQFRLSLFLFFLLGLTWIFGIFSFSNNLLWSYLFCLTSTLQGFILFIYFVILDPATRNLWITLMTPQFSTSSFVSRRSISSISSS